MSLGSYAADDMLCLQQLLESLLSQGVLILVRVQLFGQPPKVLSSLVSHHLLHSCDNQIYRGMYKLVHQEHLLLVAANSRGRGGGPSIIITIIIASIISVVLATITGSSRGGGGSGLSHVVASLFLSFIVDGLFHVVIITLTTTTCRCGLLLCRRLVLRL